MMNVKQLKEALENYDDNTEVRHGEVGTAGKMVTAIREARGIIIFH